MSYLESESTQIISMVCEYYYIKFEELKSRSRTDRVVRARFVAMYLLRAYTPMTFLEIATVFNRAEHGSVINACKKAKVYLPSELVDRCQTLFLREQKPPTAIELLRAEIAKLDSLIGGSTELSDKVFDSIMRRRAAYALSANFLEKNNHFTDVSKMV